MTPISYICFLLVSSVTFFVFLFLHCLPSTTFLLLIAFLSYLLLPALFCTQYVRDHLASFPVFLFPIFSVSLYLYYRVVQHVPLYVPRTCSLLFISSLILHIYLNVFHIDSRPRISSSIYKLIESLTCPPLVLLYSFN